MRHERELSRSREEPPPRVAERLPEHALLELQRTAGNRAVGAMLARDITTAEPADASKQAAPSGPHVLVPGIGVVPVESFSLTVGRQQPPPKDTEEAPKKDKDKKDKDLPGGDVTFTSKVDVHSSDLYRWFLDGRQKDIVIVVPKGEATMRITLKGALISAFQHSGDNESWTVNCTAMSFETVEPKP